jgi:hypothetical protein
LNFRKEKKNFMKFNVFDAFKTTDPGTALVVLVATSSPNPAILDVLARFGDIRVREAFTTRGVLQELPGVNLVILDSVLATPDTSREILERTLEMSGIPVVSATAFLAETEEWLGRARLTSARKITFLPPRQVNLVNWSGGVGKTTLAMTICRRFVARTGLPVALLELSMGGSALHARISRDLPEFFAIATHKEEAALWYGVSLYPMDGRTIEVLWSENPEGVRQVLADIRHRHTLFVVDCFPGHPLFSELSGPAAGLVNLVVTSPRDDALLQAHRLMREMPEPAYLVLNMAKNLADRAEGGVSATLPYNEGWAQSVDARLADPLLSLVYSGWNKRQA